MRTVCRKTGRVTSTQWNEQFATSQGSCVRIKSAIDTSFYKDLMRRRRTTWDENAVQGSIEETGQSVVQASVECDCLEVGILPVMRQIPL